MSELAEPLSRLVDELQKLPGIGRRSAERIAFHLLRLDRAPAMALARAIRDVKDGLRPCRVCGNVTEGEICRICSDPARERGIVCVVESSRDLIALEKSGAFRGLYHVLSGRVSPAEGRGPEETGIGALRERLLERRKEGDPVRELILATNPDAEGDATALALRENLADLGIPLSRLARGIPSGGSIEFANVEILREAFRGRNPGS